MLKWAAFSYSRESSQPRIKPLSPALAGGFFTAEPPGEPECSGDGDYFIIIFIYATVFIPAALDFKLSSLGKGTIFYFQRVLEVDM